MLLKRKKKIKRKNFLMKIFLLRMTFILMWLTRKNLKVIR
ncbi:hypothetical protein BpHYR1_023066 [Brachionus plicatilis]|uniref:Uncharacterized protein n=1 Tax=Brachionus plicatilis TaxID=10195 RepID=A0A3M7SI42_BRAPC|nr:hypothetical protein BpHYR1_023066 [Brachionus plicatilis]